MNNCLTIIIAAFIVLSSVLSFAKSKEVTIKEGLQIEENISVRPGFVTLIEFPDPIQTAIPADPGAFSCVQVPTGIACKAIAEEGEKTNLLVFTNRNKFLLTLTSKDFIKYDVVSFKYEQPEAIAVTSKNLSFLKEFLKTFSVKKIDRSKSENSVRFSVKRVVHLGDSSYFLFSIENRGKDPVSCKNIEITNVTRAYLTGLVVKKSEVQGTYFYLTNQTIKPNEINEGVLQSRRIKLDDNQEIAIKLMGEGTDRFEIMIDHLQT